MPCPVLLETALSPGRGCASALPSLGLLPSWLGGLWSYRHPRWKSRAMLSPSRGQKPATGLCAGAALEPTGGSVQSGRSDAVCFSEGKRRLGGLGRGKSPQHGVARLSLGFGFAELLSGCLGTGSCCVQGLPRARNAWGVLLWPSEAPGTKPSGLKGTNEHCHGKSCPVQGCRQSAQGMPFS